MPQNRRRWTRQEISEVYRASAGKCRVCNRRHNRESYGKTWNLDHVVPHSKRGPDAVYNLALTCIPCNSKRGNRSNEGDIAETAARRALEMERNRQGQGGKRNSGRRDQGNNRNRGKRVGQRGGSPKVHIAFIGQMGKTYCGRDASRVICGTPREATCGVCRREEGQNPFTLINRLFA